MIATNAAGPGEASSPSNVVVPIRPPDPPTNVKAIAGDGQATVSWTPPVDDGGSPITQYVVMSTPGGLGATIPVPVTGATITGLANGTAYTFTIAALNAAGDSEASESSDPVTPVGPPEPPTNVEATAGDGQATVSWTAPIDDGGSTITGYTVTSNPGGLIIATADTTTVVTDLTNGESYVFTVAATNAAGPGEASSSSNVVVPIRPPDPPTDIEAIAGDGQATVSWIAPIDDGGSSITEYTVTSNPGGLIIAAADTTTVVTGLTNGESYVFTVAATNAAGPGEASSSSNVVVPVRPPDPPTDVEAIGGDGQATVSWTSPIDDGGSPITGYTVTSKPGGLSVTIPVPATGATITGLANGTTYTFTVAATSAAGDSEASEPSNDVTPMPVPTPTVISPSAATRTATPLTPTVMATDSGGGGGCGISRGTTGVGQIGLMALPLGLLIWRKRERAGL